MVRISWDGAPSGRTAQPAVVLKNTPKPDLRGVSGSRGGGGRTSLCHIHPHGLHPETMTGGLRAVLTAAGEVSVHAGGSQPPPLPAEPTGPVGEPTEATARSHTRPPAKVAWIEMVAMTPAEYRQAVQALAVLIAATWTRDT